MRATYLHFYAAISHEAIARALHDLLETKVMSLVEAKESYLAAATSLPIANESPVDWDDGEIFEAPSSPETPWFQSPIKSRIAKYQSVSPSLATKFQFRPARASRDSMELSSLHIHKNLQIKSFPITPPRSRPAKSHRVDSDQSPPQTPPTKIRKSTTPPLLLDYRSPFPHRRLHGFISGPSSALIPTLRSSPPCSTGI